MGCCEPVLAPIQNYYTKSQVDRMISGITVSGVTQEELDAAIESAKTEIEAEIPVVPTQVSAFENDVPYLTEHQSLSAYSTTQEMNEAIASAKSEVESEIPSLSGYATEEWVEDKHYITGVDLSDYATKSEIPVVPTNVSAFNNDAGYLTEHQSLSAYSTTAEVDIMLETATSGKAETSALTAVDDAMTGHTSDSTIHVTAGDKEAWNGKQDALTPGEGIVISGNVISATGGSSGGGATYSAGTGINIDSANTITGVYRGYMSFDNPQSSLEDFSGEAYIKAPWLDCQGIVEGSAYIYTVENTDEYRYYFKFAESTKTFEVIDYPIGKENDWQDYFTIEWDDDFGVFKLTTIQQIAYANDNGCLRFFRVGTGDYSMKFSGTTEDAFNGIVDNFDNYVKSTSFWAENNKIELSSQKAYNNSLSSIELYDLTAKSNVIKTNITIGLGTSGWTQVEFNGSCSLNGDVKTPVFRLSGDTSDLANFNNSWFNTSWYVELSRYGNSYDSLYWDEGNGNFVLNSNWFGENGQFGTATVTYDPTENTVTVEYPLSVIVYGEPDEVKIKNLYNNNCYFGGYITKFEYFAEARQPLEPYVQDTRNSLSGKADTSAVTTVNDALTAHTSNANIHHTSTSAVTSGSTDVVTSGGVYEQVGGLKFQQMTLQEYSTISGSADSNTIYFIKD